MFNIQNVQEEAEKYSEGGKLLPVGWMKTVILTHETKDFAFGQALVINFENGSNLMLNFNGDEQWKRDNATQLMSKLVASVGITGAFTPARLNELCGRAVDVKNDHKRSKKLDSSGKPYVNNNIKNFAPAGTKSLQQQATPAPATGFAQAGGAGGTGTGEDVPF